MRKIGKYISLKLEENYREDGVPCVAIRSEEIRKIIGMRYGNETAESETL